MCILLMQEGRMDIDCVRNMTKVENFGMNLWAYSMSICIVFDTLTAKSGPWAGATQNCMPCLEETTHF